MIAICRNIILSNKTVLISNNCFIYCKREVNYAFYGAYACNTRIVRYVGILRRSLVLTVSDFGKATFSFKSKRSFDSLNTLIKTKRTYHFDMFFRFGTPMQIKNLQFRKILHKYKCFAEFCSL